MQFKSVSLKRFLCNAIVAAVLATAAISAASAEESIGEQQAFIEIMDGYLNLSRDVVELASKQETTIFLAIEGIVEIYEGRGEKGRAIDHLNKIMQAYPNNIIVRNLVRFKLKDIYVETGQTDKALQMLDAIIAENKD